jgi:transposase-like protein
MEKIIQINDEEIKNHLRELVRGTVEDTLNSLLDAEADALCGAQKHERTLDRTNYRSGHYQRKLHTKAGEVTLNMPKLRLAPFETAIVERYKRRESSVEEALIEMYLAGVSVRRVEDVTEALWGTKVSASTISDLNKKVYSKIEDWRQRKLTETYPYVYLDGIFLKRSWGGEVVSVSVLVAIGVSKDGYREVLGAMEGAREDKASWRAFLLHLKERGLTSPLLFIADKHLGFIEAFGEIFPETSWQRCMVHFYRNIFSIVPNGKVREVVAMLKAIHAQEDIHAARAKAKLVVARLREMKLPEAAARVEMGIEETLLYMRFPREHWVRIRTNNTLERLNREIKRRTRVVGSFPDGNSALMLVCARLRYVASQEWGSKRYLNMDLLKGHEVARQAA